MADEPAAGTVASPAEQAAAHIDVTRRRVARRSRVREMIFGTQDGLLTTLGLVTGVGGATADRYSVLVAGMAGAIAGMIAMGAGAFISSKAQMEVHEAEVDRERRELDRNPEREFEELVHLFQEDGLPEVDARVVAERIAKRPRAMLRAMAQMEMGLALDTVRPLREGVVMAGAFLVGAVVPIVPWFFASTAVVAAAAGLRFSPAIELSVAVTLVALFAMGAGKSRLAHRGILRGGLEMTGIGLCAALFGFLVGSVLPGLFGVRPGPG
ncbi:MAG TPA: VIT1/CCC1 transporter family protein [Candidatus Dormibacteraeota bacterium]|jgi:VIT1/CCC1 family predicted Fe2+/Mn2+ transporter|nr:VIT1/CCC1 transporter family protein [Candidatus Dormibacteraeota bacterium]